MPMTCTRCQNTGFINIDHIPEDDLFEMNDDLVAMITLWIGHNPGTDVAIWDCCGDGQNWYGIPGEHYNQEDHPGKYGPYSYNGDLCECH